MFVNAVFNVSTGVLLVVDDVHQDIAVSATLCYANCDSIIRVSNCVLLNPNIQLLVFVANYVFCVDNSVLYLHCVLSYIVLC